MHENKFSLSGAHLLLQISQHLKSKIFVILQLLIFTEIGCADTKKKKMCLAYKEKSYVLSVLGVLGCLQPHPVPPHHHSGHQSVPEDPSLCPENKKEMAAPRAAGAHCLSTMRPWELSADSFFTWTQNTHSGVKSDVSRSLQW